MQTNDAVHYSVGGHLTGEFTVNRRTIKVEKFRAYFAGMENGCQRRFEKMNPQRAESIDLNLTRGPSPLRIAFTETDDEIAKHSAIGHRAPVTNYMHPFMTDAWERRYGKVP